MTPHGWNGQDVGLVDVDEMADAGGLDGPEPAAVNGQMEKVLEGVHTLLLAHKYDHSRHDLLVGLVAYLPEVQAYHEALNRGDLDDECEAPVLALMLDALIRLDDAHVREAMALGYLVGTLRPVVPVAVPEREVAHSLVRCLGLEQAMAENLSYGVQLTEEALALTEAWEL